MIFTALADESVLILKLADESLIFTCKMMLKQPLILSKDQFASEIQRLKISFPIESKCLISLSLLLMLTGTYCSEVGYDYSAVRRLLYRRVLRRVRVYVDESYFSNSAEAAVASWLAEHPLVAHEPDEVMQKLARYGAAEYERRRTATSLSHTLDKVSGFFKRIYSSNPSTTHTSVIYHYEQITFHPSLSLTILISGWLSVNKDMKRKWNGLREYAIPCRATALIWDADSLKSLALSGAVLNFHRACSKAKFAGRQLASHIAKQAFGMGPVSLIGFSLGARVIYHALLALCELEEPRVHVQDVILLGGAVKNDPTIWSELVTQVAGRAINIYSHNDLVLKRIYNLAMLGKPKPVGQGPVACSRIENYDVSSYVKGHKEHTRKLATTLQVINFQP